jgi:membrane-bound ClpP family serine protease
VRVAGERWRARADAPLEPGETVEVVGIEGLTLVVRR